nr:MAG TPA: hypothetical protein [Caudoviricetes sp.]
MPVSVLIDKSVHYLVFLDTHIRVEWTAHG